MLALHKLPDVFSFRHAPSWILLTMAAGSVNAGAFLACQRFVTHVTGTVTHLGMSEGNLGLMLEYGRVLGCFVLGAMTSVLAIDGRFHRGRRPLYALPLIVVAVLLSLAALLGAAGWFGPFGGTVEQPANFRLLDLLSFTLGLQNAAVATSTGLVVRTTHLTGPATDLGIHFATCFFTRGEQRRAAIRHALLRGGKLIGFASGATLMIPITRAGGFWAFLVPAVLVLIATALSFVPSWNTLPSATARPVVD